MIRSHLDLYLLYYSLFHRNSHLILFLKAFHIHCIFLVRNQTHFYLIGKELYGKKCGQDFSLKYGSLSNGFYFKSNYCEFRLRAEVIEGFRHKDFTEIMIFILFQGTSTCHLV